MTLDSFLESRKGGLLVQSQEPPVPTSPTGMLLSDEINAAGAQAGREPIVDPIIYRV
jgi:hypothetical protein